MRGKASVILAESQYFVVNICAVGVCLQVPLCVYVNVCTNYYFVLVICLMSWINLGLGVFPHFGFSAPLFSMISQLSQLYITNLGQFAEIKRWIEACLLAVGWKLAWCLSSKFVTWHKSSYSRQTQLKNNDLMETFLCMMYFARVTTNFLRLKWSNMEYQAIKKMWCALQ